MPTEEKGKGSAGERGEKGGKSFAMQVQYSKKDKKSGKFLL